MTTPIARVVASRLVGEDLPLKLSYIANVFRPEVSRAGRLSEFTQAGIEFIGSSTNLSDAEVVALCFTLLKESGLSSFNISLGHVEFINGLLENIPPALRSEIETSIISKNLVQLEELAQNLPDTTRQILVELPFMRGDIASLQKWQTKELNARSKAALADLAELYRLLTAFNAEQAITFDLGMVRDFSY